MHGRTQNRRRMSTLRGSIRKTGGATTSVTTDGVTIYSICWPHYMDAGRVILLSRTMAVKVSLSAGRGFADRREMAKMRWRESDPPRPSFDGGIPGAGGIDPGNNFAPPASTGAQNSSPTECNRFAPAKQFTGNLTQRKFTAGGNFSFCARRRQ